MDLVLLAIGEDTCMIGGVSSRDSGVIGSGTECVTGDGVKVYNSTPDSDMSLPGTCWYCFLRFLQ